MDRIIGYKSIVCLPKNAIFWVSNLQCTGTTFHTIITFHTNRKSSSILAWYLWEFFLSMKYYLFNLEPIYSSIDQVLEELDFLEHLKNTKCMQTDFCWEICKTSRGFITQLPVLVIRSTFFEQIHPLDGSNQGKTACSRLESFWMCKVSANFLFPTVIKHCKCIVVNHTFLLYKWQFHV